MLWCCLVEGEGQVSSEGGLQCQQKRIRSWTKRHGAIAGTKRMKRCGREVQSTLMELAVAAVLTGRRSGQRSQPPGRRRRHPCQRGRR